MIPNEMITHPGKLFIDGAWITPTTDKKITVLDSATEQPFEIVAEASAADVDHAVASARAAFDTGPWPRMAHGERAEYMRRLADEIDKRGERHGRIWTSETGVLFSASQPRMETLGDSYRYYAGLANTFPFQERHDEIADGRLAIVDREPVGVVAAIVAWNGAPSLMTAKVAPALLAGCTVVVKASPEAPGPAYILAEAAEAAGLPKGVINILTADREVSEHLVKHQGLNKVAFTGSTNAGRQIASLCGERMVRVTMELGGKSPAIILDDYDIDKAARNIAARATFLSGQVCFSLTRILISRHRHDEMVAALAEHYGKVRVGDPFNPDSQMGPLAMARQRDSVEHYIALGKSEGATLAAGGGRPAHLDRGYYVEPTVFGNVHNGSTIAREEIFGPVIVVVPVDNEQAAVSAANDTIYGLNAAVFTNDAERAYSVARQVRAGTVGHNAARREHKLPFGGYKFSGIGREGGPDGLLPYLETKVVILDGLVP